MLVIMPLISEGTHGDLSTATRLTDAANLFTMLFSFYLVRLLLPLRLNRVQLFSLLGKCFIFSVIIFDRGTKYCQ